MRKLERTRMSILSARIKRINMLKKVVGSKVGILWRTGVMPAAAHGAAVNGVSDHALQLLRTTAGKVAGARPAASGKRS